MLLHLVVTGQDSKTPARLTSLVVVSVSRCVTFYFCPVIENARLQFLYAAFAAMDFGWFTLPVP